MLVAASSSFNHEKQRFPQFKDHSTQSLQLLNKVVIQKLWSLTKPNKTVVVKNSLVVITILICDGVLPLWGIKTLRQYMGHLGRQLQFASLLTMPYIHTGYNNLVLWHYNNIKHIKILACWVFPVYRRKKVSAVL